MEISSYKDLIEMARSQADAQRLLFVFTRPELPENFNSQQEREFQTGKGGILTPVMYVDKAPGDVESFATIIEQSIEMPTDWSIVFIGALSGTGKFPPCSDTIEKSFLKMIEDIKIGRLSNFLAFDKHGDIVKFL